MIDEYMYGAVFGCTLTLIIIALYFIIVHPEPFMFDCGCGASSHMCMQCINGGNLSAPICHAFTGASP